MMRIGIDLGGTKIEGVALNDDGDVLPRKRVPTPSGNYRATLHVVVALVEELERGTGARGSVGIGTPGALSRATGKIKNANSVCLNGEALDCDLAALLQRPVRIANDANCLALSEAVDGADAGADVVFAVIVGTGTGGGVAVRGRIIEGANAIAGEWGHNPLPWPSDDERPPGPVCYCGKHGCIETFLSGPASRAIIALRAVIPWVQKRLRDALTLAALMRYEDRMARALATVVNTLDPDEMVMGGGLSKLARLYHNVPALWR